MGQVCKGYRARPNGRWILASKKEEVIISKTSNLSFELNINYKFLYFFIIKYSWNVDYKETLTITGTPIAQNAVKFSHPTTDFWIIKFFKRKILPSCHLKSIKKPKFSSIIVTMNIERFSNHSKTRFFTLCIKN